MAHPTFYEVEGESPADGSWHGIYQALTPEEGKRYLEYALDNEDSPAHDRFEDFRLVPPTGNPTRVRQTGVQWQHNGGVVHRSRQRTTVPAKSAATVSTSKTKSKSSKSKHKAKKRVA